MVVEDWTSLLEVEEKKEAEKKEDGQGRTEQIAVGGECFLTTVFFASPIFDAGILREVFEFVFPPNRITKYNTAKLRRDEDTISSLAKYF